MDTSLYLNLLSALVVQLRSMGDTRGAQLIGRWVLTLEPDNTTHARRKLYEHLEQVKKSAQAIAILAVEKCSPKVESIIAIESTVKNLLAEVNRLSAELRRVSEVVDDPGIVSLEGEYLSSITFVMDYVQLDFSGSGITSYVYPTVEESGEKHGISKPGYRDALCRRIGISVTSVNVIAEVAIILKFADGSVITIHLADEKFTGPEYATYTSHAGMLWIY